MNVNVTKVTVENGVNSTPQTKKIQLEIEFNLDQYDHISHERFVEDFGKILPRAYNRYYRANTVNFGNEENKSKQQLKLDLLFFVENYCKERNGDKPVDKDIIKQHVDYFYNLVTN